MVFEDGVSEWKGESANGSISPSLYGGWKCFSQFTRVVGNHGVWLLFPPGEALQVLPVGELLGTSSHMDADRLSQDPCSSCAVPRCRAVY